MIRLTRTRTEAAIPASFRGEGRRAAERRLLLAKRDHLVRLQSDPAASHGFLSTWWKAAKPTLRKESFGKCAYCEARADAVAHCDVEHIRPKSEWWWLTCCWDNYCFSCQLCNQKFKVDSYPIRGARRKGPPLKADTSDATLETWVGALAPDPLDAAAVAQLAASLAKEKAELPDPYFDDPEALFAWEVRPASGHVVLVPRTKYVKAKRAAAAAEKYLGLNREELCELRYETYELLEIMKDVLEDPAVPTAHRSKITARLATFMAPRRAFAAMCRYFIRDVWRLLPA